MPTERSGLLMSGGAANRIIGRDYQVGIPATEIELRVGTIASMSSLETSVFVWETRKLSSQAADLNKQIEISSLNTDLKCAQKRWYSAASVGQMYALGDHFGTYFGEQYAGLDKEIGPFRRAIFVVDGQDKAGYNEFLTSIYDESNGNEVLQIAQVADSN